MTLLQQNITMQLYLDRQYHLVEGDPKIAEYHHALGGEKGTLCKIAAIVELAVLSSKLGMRVHRNVRFSVHDKKIRCWADISPEDHGYAIKITNLKETGPSSDHDEILAVPHFNDSEGWLRLDSNHKIIGGNLPEEIAGKADINSYIGSIWPALLRPVDDPDFATKIARGSFPLWQMLDGQKICFWPYAKTEWLLRIVPNDDDKLFTWHFIPSDNSGKKGDENIGDIARQSVDNVPHRRLFIHSVAPALRAPVVRIMANARTISEEKTGPLRNQYAGYAEDIAQAAEHLLALIDDASDLEAVDGADFRYSEEDVDLCDVARRAAGLLRVKAQSRDITIDIPPPEEHLICRAEFRRALQIVLNLLSNAIRYGPKDAMIWIRAEAAGDMARLTVSDMGKGISADEQQVIFDKFERLGRSGDGGSGLGLYISKKLAVAMGGNILIDSAPGKGVRISLELPLKKGASA